MTWKHPDPVSDHNHDTGPSPVIQHSSAPRVYTLFLVAVLSICAIWGVIWIILASRQPALPPDRDTYIVTLMDTAAPGAVDATRINELPSGDFTVTVRVNDPSVVSVIVDAWYEKIESVYENEAVYLRVEGSNSGNLYAEAFPSEHIETPGG